MPSLHHETGQHETGEPETGKRDMAAASLGERFQSIRTRVQMAFDAMSDATVAAPRMDRNLAPRLRAPLGRLMAAGQVRDTFDQRMAHVEGAFRRAAVLEEAERAAVFHVTAMQLVELSRLIEKTAGEAGAAFHGLGELAETPSDDVGSREPAPQNTALAALARAGLRAAADLSAASEILAIEAEGHAALVERSVPAAQIAAADLGWMLALYTMDAERRVHRMAIAQAAGGQG